MSLTRRKQLASPPEAEAREHGRRCHGSQGAAQVGVGVGVGVGVVQGEQEPGRVVS